MKRAVSEPVCRRNLAGQRQNVRLDMKKMEEESRAVEMALENHNLFIFGLCCTGKCFSYSKTIIFLFLVPFIVTLLALDRVVI